MKKNDGGTKLMKRVRANWNRMKNDLPVVLGNTAVNHFVQSFRNQGFLDESASAWAPRKTADSGRATLVKTGNLRRSIRVAYATWSKISVISDTDYSHIHNYGGIAKAWGKTTFRMKQRRFMGFSHELNKKSLMEIRKRLARVFR